MLRQPEEQLEESFVEAQRALALGPADADAHHLVGQLLALQGRMPDALAHREAAVN